MLKEIQIYDQSFSAVSVRRTVKIAYRELSLDMEVHSLQHEAHLRLAAKMKSFCAGRDGGLPLLDWELPVWGPVAGSVGDIGQEHLRAFRSARQTLVQVWKDGGLTCIQDLLEALRRRVATLLGVDETFSIEVAATEVAAKTTCKFKLEQAVMNCLPSLTVDHSIDAAVAMCTEVTTGTLFHLMPQSERAEVEVVSEMLHQLQRGNPPKGDISGNKFLARARARTVR